MTRLKEPSFQEAYCESFRRKMLSVDYKRHLSILIQDLDPKSAEIAELIVKNIKHRNYKTSYTKEGRKILHNIERDFYAQIRKVDDVFLYSDHALPVNHFETSVFLYHHGLKEMTGLDDIKSKDIIDVGGFIGDSAIVFSNYTDKKVHSFEPVTENYNLMLRTIHMNRKENIIPVKKGLGRKRVKEQIKVSGSASSIAMNIDSKETEQIEIETLDNYVRENNLKVGLVKVDIEGYEQDFLLGAQEVIKQQKPILLLSIYHSPNDFFFLKDMVKSVRHDYRFSIYKSANTDCLSETLLIAL